MTVPSHAPRVSSTQAAAEHARLLAAGRPRDHRLLVSILVLSLAGAATTVAVAPVVAAFLAVLAVALGCVVIGDGRSTWRYADTARPGRPPRVVPAIPAQPSGPVVLPSRDATGAPRQMPVG